MSSKFDVVIVIITLLLANETVQKYYDKNNITYDKLTIPVVIAVYAFSQNDIMYV